MEWKEFIKPDRQKILLMIIVFLLMPNTVYYDILSICNMTTGEGCNEPPSIGSTTLPFAFPLLLWAYLLHPEGMGIVSMTMNLVFQLFGFIISYPISCTVIFLYDKYKTRSGK